MKDILEQVLVSLPKNASIEDVLEATFISLKIFKRIKNSDDYNSYTGLVGFTQPDYISPSEMVDEVLHWCSYKRML